MLASYPYSCNKWINTSDSNVTDLQPHCTSEQIWVETGKWFHVHVTLHLYFMICSVSVASMVQTSVTTKRSNKLPLRDQLSQCTVSSTLSVTKHWRCRLGLKSERQNTPRCKVRITDLARIVALGSCVGYSEGACALRTVQVWNQTSVQWWDSCLIERTSSTIGYREEDVKREVDEKRILFGRNWKLNMCNRLAVRILA
jgi:hypothetical protein